DFFATVSVLVLRIFEKVPRQETAIDRDVDVFVDRRGDDKAPELAVVRGQIGAASADRDPQRRPRHDHGHTPASSASGSTSSFSAYRAGTGGRVEATAASVSSKPVGEPIS